MGLRLSLKPREEFTVDIRDKIQEIIEQHFPDCGANRMRVIIDEIEAVADEYHDEQVEIETNMFGG